MDFRAKEASWLEQANLLFSGTAIASNDPDQCNIRELKQSLRNLSHRQMKTWWNRASLENYLHKHLIPRGLRVQIFPSFGLDQEVYVKKWEEACNTCSRTLMMIIMEHNTQVLMELGIQIEKTETDIAAILPNNDYPSFKQDLEESQTIWEKQIKATKSKKFLRDSNDFSNNKVYKWKRGPVERRQRSPSVSSSVSTGVESVASSRSSARNAQYDGRRRNYRNKANTRNERQERVNTRSNDTNRKR
ncbi:uncharacterized protein LOC130298356 [Hyla sarda]|uniref:uncharacterized protein LOC130298356 n=1 Tax=Hyla sarda TaxID=327740 RepID=UPI0024C2901D|nr:uncharacterized protein LOC130298356 [Hyla sarda]